MADKPTYEELEQRVEELTAELETANEALKKQIEERKQTEETLHAYEQIVSTITDRISFLDTNYRYQVANDAYLKAFLDKPREDVVRYTPAYLFGEKNFRNKIKPNLDKCLRGEIVNYQDQFEFLDKGKRYIDVSYYPVFSEDGSVSGIVHVLRDITEWKKIDRNLHDSQHMLQTVLDSIPAAVFWKNRDLFYLGGNRTWLAAVGLNSSQEVVGKSDYELPWYKEQADSFREDDRKVIESGIPEYDILEPYLKADGTQAWAKTNKVPLRDAEGNILGVLGTYEDITERKKAEEELRESEERYRRITGAITDYIYTVTVQDGCPVETVHGPACAAVTGYTAKDFKENPYLWIQMVHEEDREAVKKLAADTLSGVKVPALEHRIIRKDGATRWVRNTPVLNFDSQARLLSYDGLVQDVTERKQAEEALRKAHHELERFNLELEEKVQERTKELKQKNKQLVEAERLAALGKMANRVAHELRNPLTAIGGFARRINEKTPAGDPNKKYLQMIVENVITIESKVSEITRIQSL